MLVSYDFFIFFLYSHLFHEPFRITTPRIERFLGKSRKYFHQIPHSRIFIVKNDTWVLYFYVELRPL
jgi:hypothetical protein